MTLNHETTLPLPLHLYPLFLKAQLLLVAVVPPTLRLLPSLETQYAPPMTASFRQRMSLQHRAPTKKMIWLTS